MLKEMGKTPKINVCHHSTNGEIASQGHLNL